MSVVVIPVTVPSWWSCGLQAYLREGSRHFNVPAQIGGPAAAECVQGGCPQGNEWAPVAQELISANISDWTVVATNQLRGAPVHTVLLDPPLKLRAGVACGYERRVVSCLDMNVQLR